MHFSLDYNHNHIIILNIIDHLLCCVLEMTQKANKEMHNGFGPTAN